MAEDNKAATLIRATFESLQRSGIISAAIVFSEETVLLGSASELDSLGFVTFISDLEERVSESAGDEVFLVLDDISNFNLNNPSLTVKALAAYVAGLLGQAA
jgi:hypothetical protein